VWAERGVFFFARVRINNEKRPVSSSCLACRLSACIIAAVTGRIFVKLNLRNSGDELYIFCKCDNDIGHFTLRPERLYVVGSGTKCLVNRQQCKGKLFVRVCDNTVGLRCWQLHQNNTERTNCYVPIATVVTWTRHNKSLYARCLPRWMLNLEVYRVTTVTVKDDLSVAVAASGMQLCLDSGSTATRYTLHQIQKLFTYLSPVTNVHWRGRTLLRAVRSNNATVFVVVVLIPIFRNP